MTLIQIIFLGILQGLTEFLPVSSSGHLELAEHFLGFKELDKLISFNLICHMGTLGAILVYFARPIAIVLRHDFGRVLQVVVATTPLFLVALLIKPIKSLFTIEYLGFFFLITAFLLFLGMYYKVSDLQAKSGRSLKDSLLIGFLQALAVLPGVSRSGATISCARILGWKHYDAAFFSFLIAIPAIMGGMLFESLELLTGNETENIWFSPFENTVAFVTSFIAGYFGLNLLMKLAAKDRFHYFMWYCLFLGLITIGLQW